MDRPMSEDEKRNVLFADKPGNDPKDDRLGYAPFAKLLADSIRKMSPPEGLVLAIYGQWGSGKTTVLGYIVYYLEQQPETEQPIIVRFNPWWFSGHEELAVSFLSQLGASLSTDKSTSKAVGHIKNLSDTYSEAGAPGSSWVKFARGIFGWGKLSNVAEIKSKVSDVLSGQNKHILVIVDDIDRLTSEEIRQLFRVIKAVADFPNVIYLLAFDKSVVVEALKETQGVSGEDFLKKIVQVPFELPLPDKVSLSKLFFEKLDVVLIDTPEYLWDKTHWGNLYNDGIKHFFITARDVVRFINTLSVTYPPVRGEVNPADFFAIETLRVFVPSVYDIIRKNRTQFAGRLSPHSTLDYKADQLKSFHQLWMSQIPRSELEPIKRMLVRLFPMLENLDRPGLVSHGSEWDAEWSIQLRVCSQEIFDTYFRLAILDGNISNLEMNSIIKIARDREAFSSQIRELSNQKRPDGISRVRIFLERFYDYVDVVATDDVGNVVGTLFSIGDELIHLSDENPFSPFDNNETKIGRIIWRLLQQSDETARFEIFKKAMLEAQSVSIIVDQIYMLGADHGKYGAKGRAEEERFITLEHLQELEQIALEKIRAFAEQNIILKATKIRPVLGLWRELSSEDELKEWITRVTEDLKGLVRFVEKFLWRSHSHSISDAVSKMRYRLDPKWIEQYLNPDEVYQRFEQSISEIKLTQEQAIAIGQFVHEYELRKEGRNPEEEF